MGWVGVGLGWGWVGVGLGLGWGWVGVGKGPRQCGHGFTQPNPWVPLGGGAVCVGVCGGIHSA